MENETITCPKCGEINQATDNYCSKCATPLKENLSSGSKPQKKNTGCLVVFLCFLGIIIFFIIICSIRGANEPTSAISTTYSTSRSHTVVNTPPALYTVEYKVSGSASSVSLTYKNSTGGTEQKDVYTPWSTSFKCMPGNFLYLSAQNEDKTGSVTCEIWVNGILYKTSTSSGAYVIASCNGRV